ncbi:MULTISPECIES: aminotransferase class I/II-fold pyridoxal phosphate-dependent enzyme [unclassified Undibacterium]|uniref:aminotransferase class I/II-fold pyridoxal phosphate-dependent enzyme n=1 Tax=unclassified Undibacterium TaxID=2630295 RepID=UPI002AC98245|nr:MULTISPECIES: aminotransferase class I/II-fold pyridoxal phosphate-dependent enzyme [unclassified Undibacterium]MEB0140494.1 aminotransferase class I/II-fold pyridoxal phosphate-dependent enzyme [Undibacterium sp. CCC2.1]MEB0174163.1 aminotransferase class I/II-fold pyridoxal phosphate-dependent enzyme [Undibacterium sp. CCC1.1]MEB0178098.1 aminotransferase class I/II-fold pyridoxal phosphate-dependent enzyme [Undibacterium sp. CCC3.4]MEB0217313.1 aminotransferase class I/II-fold pyridoxal p
MSDSKNAYINTERTISIGNPSWQLAQDSGLTDRSVTHVARSRMRDQNEHEFMNMCSCSYLGLEIDPRLAQRGAEYVLRTGTVNLPTSRIRIRLKELDELEDALSLHFSCAAFTATSCSAGIVASLPLLAAGVFTDGQRPFMIFDKHAHFALNQVKAVCGDETEVSTCNHNDVDFIEDMCKRHPLVAYIADGAYSMGGAAPIERLLELQEKYGLFLYFDDSHSLSAYGERGEGYIRSFMPELSARTILVYSLAKAFGANGGGIFISKRANYIKEFRRFGGPMSYSQYLNPAAIGAALASIEIHRTPELAQLQQRLKRNINHFDQLIPTQHAGTELPIRVVPMDNADMAVRVSQAVFRRGYYTSAVFFPIVARNKSGLRVMMRADMSQVDMDDFCISVNEEKLRYQGERSGLPSGLLNMVTA